MSNEVAHSADAVFATRASVLEPETIWRLTPDALVRERFEQVPDGGWVKAFRLGLRILFPWAEPPGGDKWPDIVPYENIVSIRVRFDPTRVDRTRERCDLALANGTRIALFSSRYVSFANFDDQTQVFKPFIEELTRRVLAARPQTSVYSGLTWTSYLIQHGFVLAAVLALASILGVAGFPPLGTVWMKLFIVLSYVGLLWAYSRRNLPRKLNPPPD